MGIQLIGVINMDHGKIREQLKKVLDDLTQKMDFHSIKLLVIGCSTSEIMGKHIGQAGSMEVAEIITEIVFGFQRKYEFNLAVQCCEHLNRALVVEKKTAIKYNLEEVQALPVSSAGGAFPTCIYKHMSEPVLVLEVSADAGIDIGDTFIGMHLKRVAVPVRPGVMKIGKAHVTAAKIRPLLVGGERAVYKNNL